MDPISILVHLLIGATLSVAGSALSGVGSQGADDEIADWEDPTVSAVRQVPYLVGTDLISSANVIWFGEKSVKTRKVPMEGVKS